MKRLAIAILVTSMLALGGSGDASSTEWIPRGELTVTRRAGFNPLQDPLSTVRGTTTDAASQAQIVMRWTNPAGNGTRVRGGWERYCAELGTDGYPVSSSHVANDFDVWLGSSDDLLVKRWSRIGDWDFCTIDVTVDIYVSPARPGTLRVEVQQL